MTMAIDAEQEHIGDERAISEAVAPFVGYRLARVEKYIILLTLEHCKGNRTHAAAMLGISLRCLRYKIAQYAGEDGDIVERICTRSLQAP